MLAGLGATPAYGIAAHYTKRRIAGVALLVVAAGSQIAATMVLLPLVPWNLPPAMPSLRAWGSAAALGALFTGLAYLLYFRLLALVGPTRAVGVTYIIPIFGMLWGALFLGQQVTPTMLLGAVAIVGGASAMAHAPIQSAVPDRVRQ